MKHAQSVESLKVARFCDDDYEGLLPSDKKTRAKAWKKLTSLTSLELDLVQQEGQEKEI